jgi:hypothetical protein
MVVIPHRMSAFVLHDKATTCFPHALPNVPRVWLTNHYVNASTGQTEQNLLEQLYGKHTKGSKFRQSLQNWMLQERRNTWFCGEHKCKFTEPDLSVTIHDMLLASSEEAAAASNSSSREETLLSKTTRLIHLSTYFIHYDWIKNYQQDLREIFTIDRTCCQTIVPAEVVLMHFRNSEDDDFRHNLTPDMVLSIWDHYNYTDRPLWIVCEPDSRETVQSLVNSLFHNRK